MVGVVNETLRIFPPAPEPTQRTNDGTAMMINGNYIPPNTNVSSVNAVFAGEYVLTLIVLRLSLGATP